jgi:hypothetical protein
MEPLSPQFLSQIAKAQELAQKQADLVNKILTLELSQTLIKVAADADKALAPLRSVMQSHHFQQQMRVIQELYEKLSLIYTQPVVTVDDFDTFNTLYEVATDTAREAVVTKQVETKDEEAVAFHIFSSTKVEARKGRLITPLKLPPSVKWEYVRVTFVDKHTVFIEFPTINQKITVDFMDMGMWDGRNQTPNAQWVVWEVLAESEGRISWNSDQAAPRIKKQKQLLSEALKKYFNIQGDPFKVYQEAKAYELKMQMIASGRKNVYKPSEDQSVYDEMTPSVPENTRRNWVEID